MADHDAIAFDADFLVQAAEHRIVLGEMGERGGVGEVVDGDEIDILIVQTGAHYVAADAAKSVDCYFHWHTSSVPSPEWLGLCVKFQDSIRKLPVLKDGPPYRLK